MARPIIDLSSKTFGSWTVIGSFKYFHNKNGSRSVMWQCRCKCGTIRYVRSHALILGTSVSCDCSRRQDIVGKRFGKLVVLELLGIRKVGNTKTAPFYNCLCDCGKTKIIKLWDLNSGRNRSCGCLNTIGRCKKKGETGFNLVYDAYERGAIKRNIDFSLTKEEVLQLVIQPCIYYGNGPSRGALTPSRRAKYGSEETINQSQFLYTGIDRVDNTKGYTLDNSVPCCFDCNIAKHQMSQKQFVEFVSKIYKYFVEKQS